MRGSALGHGARRGFTLVELLIALALLAIIAAIGFKSLVDAKESAYVAVMVSDLRQLLEAEEMYYLETGEYFTGDVNDRRDRRDRDSRFEFMPSEGVRVRIRGGRNGWTARAQHTALRGSRHYCAVFVGDVRRPMAPAQTEGVVACREPERRRRDRRRDDRDDLDDRPGTTVARGGG